MKKNVDFNLFFDELILILKKYIQENDTGTKKTLEFLAPEELKKKLDLSINMEKSSHEDLINTVNQILKYSVNTQSVFFNNQLFTGADPFAIL